MKNSKRSTVSKSSQKKSNSTQSGENSLSDSEPIEKKKKDIPSLSISNVSSTTSSESSDEEENNQSAKAKSKNSSSNSEGEDSAESEEADSSEDSSEASEDDDEDDDDNEDDDDESEEDDDDPTVFQYSKDYGVIRRSTRQRKQTRFSSESDSDTPVRTRAVTKSKKNAKNTRFSKSKNNKGRRGKNQKGRKSTIVQKKKTATNSRRSRAGMMTRMSLRQNVKRTRFSSDDSYSSNEDAYTSESESESEETTTEETEELIDEEESVDEEEEEKEESIQYIIGQKDVFTEHVTDNVTDNTESESEDNNEYYVKFNGKSYIHCRWMKQSDIANMKGGESALRRWNNRSKGVELEHSLSFPSLLTIDEADANSLWLEVDRIIDEAGDGDRRKYHVKWKGLNYDESTWEKASDIPEEKIAQFHERLDRSNPIRIPTRYKRPSPDSFEEIKEPITTPDGELKLRPYQMEGFNWLRSRWYNNLNSILADEMGLGKTVQVVCALNDLALHEGISGPFLVVAPLSTLPHWQMEFERWTKLNVVVYHGNSQSRDLIRQTEFVVVNEEGETVKNAVQFDVLITNYDTMLIDFNIFAKIQWRYLVLDEAHKLKNSKGKLYQKMEALEFEYCVMLTGTPIQNRIDELWSLLHFLFPNKFDDLEGFKEKYENPTSSKQVGEIQAIINPIILRRKKSDVEKAILPKEETIIDVELSRQQKNLYKALFQQNAGIFFNRIGGGALPALQNLMMQLRKVCNHPYLIKGAEQVIIREKREQYKGQNKTPEEIDLLAMIESSGKMILIDKLLPKLRSDHHKVLIFSQMVRVLDIIEDYLVLKGYPNERIDGSKSDKERQAAIDRFNADGNAFVFLLSTRAGGVGINLTSADTVIIYDSDWNPQNDIQAEARCHRIGQSSKVKVYRLIMKDTYESKMFETASKKLGLDHAILDGDLGTSDGKNSKVKAQEIEEMLRNGIHSIFKDDDNEIDNFSSADIDQILERNAKSKIEDVVTGGGSVFAHAKFNITNNDNDNDEDKNGNLENDKESDKGTKDFWKDYLDSNQNSLNSHLMIRRCRKNQLERSTSFETVAVKKVISNLINKGYSGDPNELEIIRYAAKYTSFVEKNHQKLFESVFGKDSDNNENSDNETNKYPNDNESELVYSASLLSRSESNNFTPSSSMSNVNEEEQKIGKINVDSESAYVIEEKSDPIIERVLFFLRIKRVLMFIQQQDNYQWPIINPSWKGPDSDYALLLSYFKYGRHNLLENILNDEELNEAIEVKVDKDGNVQQTHILNSKSISRRISQLVDEIENQIPAEFFELDENVIISSENFPAESKNKVELKNGSSVYQFAPMNPKLWRETHSKIMLRTNLEDFEVVNLASAIQAYGLPRKFHKKENKEGSQSSQADDDQDFSDVDWEKLKDLANLTFINTQTIEEMSRKIVTMSEEKEPDMTKLPQLTDYKLKRVKTSVRDMEKIYKFANKLRHDNKSIIEMLKKLDKFGGIEWWNYECDIALINSIAKYGLMKFSIWMIDQSLPFYKHIPQEALIAFANAASSEKKKIARVALLAENLPEDIILLKEKSRIERARFVIRSVHKMLDMKKKEISFHTLNNLIMANRNPNNEQSQQNKPQITIDGIPNKNTFFANILQQSHLNNSYANAIQLLTQQSQTPESIALKDIESLNKNQPVKVSKNIELLKIGSLVMPFDKHYEGKGIPFPVGYSIKRDFKRKEWPRKRLFSAEIETGEKGPLFKVTITDEKIMTTFSGPNATAPWKQALEYIEEELQQNSAEQNNNDNSNESNAENNNAENGGNNNENEDEKKAHNVPGVTLFGLSLPRVIEIVKKLPNADAYPSLKKMISNEKFKPANFHINIPKVDIPENIDNI